jgi:hypothetical protein
VQLHHLSRGLLLMFAGGDPWKVDASLQAGRPSQINDLAQAFHNAGSSAAEADKSFSEALKRFEGAWNRENGEHPINDAAEVQRAIKSLGLQAMQLPQIAADLENVAAALAEVQRTSSTYISMLESRLQTLDDWIGEAEDLIKQDESLLAQATDADDVDDLERDIDRLNKYVEDCEKEAINDTKDTLASENSIREGYSNYLRLMQVDLKADGYDPAAIQALDAPESPAPTVKLGEVKSLGAIAGTGSNPGIPGLNGADLGEIVRLPNGQLVAVFGDAFSGKNMDGDHYRSVAVPITGFDAAGRPIFGAPLTGPENSGHELFSLPQEAIAAGANDTLPAGTIQMNGKTYMMVVGTKDLKPVGGSWLVEVTDHPGDPLQGWNMVPGSFRDWHPPAPGQPVSAPTQISGYQGKDGRVYIAADSFDRSGQVTLYRADPSDPTNRALWQPWTGSDWGPAGQTGAAAPLSPTPFGELSFREIDGHPVLSGFDAKQGPDGAVEVRVANSPTEIFSNSATTVIAQAGDPKAPNWVPQNYGGFILPGSTLDNLGLFASQWHDGTYNTQQFVANVKPPP